MNQTLRPSGPAQNTPFYRKPGVRIFGQFGVLPSEQGNGLGLALVRACEDLARRAGAEFIALDTAEGAHHLIAWYGRLGYAFVEMADWSHTNYRSVIMAKTLAP